MALIDDVVIKVKAGTGGNGGKSYKTYFGSTNRHPDGGNGGRGGNIYFEGTANLNDLSEFRYKKSIKAEDGVRGGHKDLDGKYGKDEIVLVPLGTTIIDTNTQEAFEIVKNRERILIARGGDGGIGNHDLINVPGEVSKITDIGKTGEEKQLHLILNLIADIGLIGLPNAGKSSLLSALTKATPKIGNYPFTTLEPNLGTMDVNNKRIVLADIPGLVEGASKGKGLGIQFLKHIQKTKVLLHMIDITTPNLFETYSTVRSEFEDYDPTILLKKEIILLTKIDLVDFKTIKEAELELKKTKSEILTISIYNEKSLNNLKRVLSEIV